MKNEDEFELEDLEKHESKKTKSKKILLFSILVILVGLTAFALINKNGSAKYPGLETKIKNALISAERVSGRPDYLPEVMFKELPKFPKDFYAKRVLYRYGLLEMDPEIITPDYWKQPEWYPIFEENTVKVLQNAPADRYGVCCFGIYPADAYIRLDMAGDKPYTFTKYTWMRSAPLVELYQGVKLDPYYPKIGNVEKDLTPWRDNPKIDFVQDPEVAKKYIHIEFAPRQFLLDPSFPIFKKEYIKLIEMTVTIDSEIPKGNYIVGFDTVAPDDEVSLDWMLKYAGSYNDARMGMFFSPRQYRLFITVE